MGQPLSLAKQRGAFFTPPVLSDFLTEWAIRSPHDRILEPSCGHAAFLISAAQHIERKGLGRLAAGQLVGVDIHPQSVEKGAVNLEALGARAQFHVGDFFDFATGTPFDAVIGNPPYVRYQTFSGEARAKATQAAFSQGVRLTGLASSWAAFVVHAASFLNEAGRLALVLPAELLSVNYAAPVREFLMKRFERVQLVLFRERAFPGVLEEVVLLLCEGPGPAAAVHLFEAKNAEDLTSPHWDQWTPPTPEAKWTPALLSEGFSDLYEELTGGAGFSTLLDWGETNLGMVSGNNRYFTLTADDVKRLGLRPEDLLRISPPGSRHLRGLTFDTKAWEGMLRDGRRVYLFNPDRAPSAASLAYIGHGEAQGVHNAYKCRVRRPWWKVPRVKVPDLFLTYMNHDTPRLVTNDIQAHYLNSIHGVVLRREVREAGRALLPLAALNSVTTLGAELVGRSYGGGILKLEPKEGDRLPVPAPSLVAKGKDDLEAIRPQLATHLGNRNLEEAVRLVDNILLVRHLGVRRSKLRDLREAREALFQRRVSRSRKVR